MARVKFFSFFLLSIFLFILVSCLPKTPSLIRARGVAEEAIDEARFHFQEESRLSISDSWPEEAWWEIFEDEQLTWLIETALCNNPTLDQARLRIEKAYLESEKARSYLYPFVNLMGDVQRNKLSKTGVFPSSPILAPGFPQVPIAPPIPFYYTQFESSLNFEYDLDLWGRRQAQIAAKGGEWASLIFTERFSRLSLAAAVGETYFSYLAALEEVELLHRLIDNRAKVFALTKEKAGANLESEETTLLAESNLSEMKKALFAMEMARDFAKHRLYTLVASDFIEEIYDTPLCEKKIPTVPIPCEIPLHLIANRPDIQAQLWLIKSSEKKIYVETTRFYPDVNLFGFIGYQTLHLHEFFLWPSVYANATSAFRLPLFDANLRQNELDIAGVEANFQIRQYEALLLDATNQVLDSLSSLVSQERQKNSLKESALQLEKIMDLTSLKVKHELASEIDRLEKEKNFLVACQQVTKADERMAQSILSLVRALGGGLE